MNSDQQTNPDSSTNQDNIQPQATEVNQNTTMQEPVQTPPTPEIMYDIPPMYTNEPPIKKDHKKQIIILGGIGAVAALALIAILCICILFQSPKTIVLKGLNATLQSKSSPVLDYIGSDDLIKMMNSTAFQENISLSLDDIKMNSMYGDLSSVTALAPEIDFSTMIDYPKKKMAGTYSLLLGGSSAFTTNVYGDNNALSLACPEFFEGYLSLNSDTFGHDYNNSIWTGYTSEPLEEDLGFNLFDYGMSNINTELALSSDYQKKYAKDYKELCKSIEVTKIDNEKINWNKKEITCKGYHVFIPNKIIITTLNNSLILEYTTNGMSDADAKASAKNVSDKVSTFLNKNDIEFNVFLDKKGRVIKLTGENSFSYKGSEYNVNADLLWQGKTNLFDNFKANLKITDGTDKSLITLTNKSSLKNTVTTDQLALSVTDVYDVVSTFEYTGKFDTKKGSLSGTGTINTDHTPVLNLSFEGAFDNVKKGESYAFDLSNLSIDIAGSDSNESRSILLSGSCSILPYTDTIAAPTGTNYPIFQMSEQDVTKLVTEISSNFSTSTIGSLLGYSY